MPTWLTIELALIPVVLAGLAGLVWLVRLEAGVKQNKENDKLNKENMKELTARQAKHNDRLYDEARTINKNLHLIMGKLQIPPIER